MASQFDPEKHPRSESEASAAKEELKKGLHIVRLARRKDWAIETNNLLEDPMMILPSSKDLKRLKGEVDFIALASRYTRLHRRAGQYVGLCPLHSERHPSFYVHPEKKIFYCFGCEAGGDVFDFVMQVENLPFSAAVQWLRDLRYREEVSGGRRVRPAGFAGRASQGAKPPNQPKADHHNSPTGARARARIIEALDAADRRLAAWEEVTRAELRRLATPCEPFDEDAPLLLERKS